MVRNRQALLVLALVSLVALGAFATGAQEAADGEEQVELRMYVRYADEESMVPYDYAEAALAEEYPNVSIERVEQGPDPGQELRTFAATGNLPDIFDARLDVISLFIDSGDILQLDDYAEELGFVDKVLPSARNTLYHTDGHIWAFPFVGNEFFLLYYNKALFDEHGVAVPETYEQLKRAVTSFNENDVIPMSLFAGQKWPTVSFYDAFVTRLEPEGIVALDQGRARASDPAYRQAADAIYELVQMDLFPRGVTTLNYEQARALFYDGRAAMFMNGHWEIADSTDALGDDVDWIPYPVLEGNEENRLAFAGGGGIGGFAVSPDSEHVDTAVRVAALFAERYAEARLVKRGNPIVALDIDMEPEVDMDPMMRKLADILPDVKSNTTFAWGMQNAQVKTALEDASQQLLTGDYPPEDFASDVDRVIEREFD